MSNENIPIDKVFGILIGLTAVLLPNVGYSNYPESFGQSLLLGLMVSTALGGGLTFSCLASKGKRILAFLPGIVAGLGSFGLTYAAVNILGQASLKFHGSGFILLWAFAGTCPGFLLAFILRVFPLKTKK